MREVTFREIESRKVASPLGVICSVHFSVTCLSVLADGAVRCKRSSSVKSEKSMHNSVNLHAGGGKDDRLPSGLSDASSYILREVNAGRRARQCASWIVVMLYMSGFFIIHAMQRNGLVIDSVCRWRKFGRAEKSAFAWDGYLTERRKLPRFFAARRIGRSF